MRDIRGGRRSIRAGQEDAHCRAITYQERLQIWGELVDLHHAGKLSKCAVAVAFALLFGFLNMETGQCNPRIATLIDALCPRFNRASIFRAFKALEETGRFKRHPQRSEVFKIEGGRRVRKIVQGATLYQFMLEQTATMKEMAQKALDLVKGATRKVWAPVPAKLSGSQIQMVPSENLYKSLSFEGKGTPKGWARLEAALARIGEGVSRKSAA